MNIIQSMLRKLTIKNRIMFGYLALFFVVFNITSLSGYMMMKDWVKEKSENELTAATELLAESIVTSLDVTIRNYLRAISELNLQYVESCYAMFLRGEITEQEAKDKVIRHFSGQIIGEEGYPYVIDSSGVIKIHPSQELKNTSLIKYDFIQEQVNRKQGYLEYKWKNPGESTERPKALHMVYFEPWDWILTSSSYRHEFSTLIDVNDFNESVSTLKFDDTGYLYVINDKGDFIIHPFFEGNFYDVHDSKGKYFVQQILKQKNGVITYTWKNPQEVEFREKLAVFRYLPEFGWYVVASTYTQELNQPLNEIKFINFLILFFSIVIIIPLNLLLSRSIVIPLKNVMKQIEVASTGEYKLRVIEQAGVTDELAQLAGYFNHFLTELDESHQELFREIQERLEAQQSQIRLNNQLEELNERLEEKVAERTEALKSSMDQLKQMQDQLVESEKLSALGGLVAGVAHEVNTPLGIAITSASLIAENNHKLKMEFESQSLTSEQFSECVLRQSEAIELLEDNLHRASKLIQDFKQTAVYQTSERSSDIVVFQVLEALIASLHSETRKVPVTPQLIGDGELVISGYPGVITQIFSQLILNSVQHAFVDQPQPEIVIHFRLSEGGVVFSYRDNGCGVSPELHKKIFEPFYTSKRGKGNSGLGLSSVFNLVTQKLNGNIEFHSENGFEIIIFMPLNDEVVNSITQ